VLPPPARVGRSDVASLAISACDPSIVPSGDSYTLAVRWVGEVAPKSQGSREDGCGSAEACLKGVADESAKGVVKFEDPNAVGSFFYSFAAVSLKLGSVLFQAAMQVFRRA